MSLKNITLFPLVLCCSTALTICAEMLDGGGDGQGQRSHLRRDGVYSLVDSSFTIDGRRGYEVHKLYAPLIFINDTAAVFLYGMDFVDSSILRLENYVAQGKDIKRYVGRYSIAADTISATIPTNMVLAGQRLRLFPVHYRGILKDSNTIVHWQMIAPYPKVKMKWNKDGFDRLRAPNTLLFVVSKELLGLDQLVRHCVER